MSPEFDAVLGIFDAGWLMSSLRLAMPLVLAAMAGVVCERSGVVNIALEGLMIVGALFGAVVSVAAGNQGAGLLAALIAGAIAGMVYGFFVLHGRSQQIIAGAAFNMLAAGLAPYILKAVYGVSGGTPPFEASDHPAAWSQSLVFWLAVSIAVMMPVLIWWVIEQSRAGLYLRFAGEEPGALDSAGISRTKVRMAATLCSGALAGLAGATLSVVLSSAFSRGMVGGRGFMALAAVIFAGWRPLQAALVCLMFAAADAAQIRLQGAQTGWLSAMPVQAIQAFPYVLTLVALALRSKAVGVPRYLGRD
jgi:simple sugar transport system permease protein